MARLLIVEDNVAYADDVADYLAENGYQVTIGATAQSMWNALDGPPVDVVLLDLGLPDACGMALIPQLRERFSDTGILVLTARGMLDSRLQALRSGAHDYVTKPIKFDVLSRHIEQLCERMVKPPPRFLERAWPMVITPALVHLKPLARCRRNARLSPCPC